MHHNSSLPQHIYGHVDSRILYGMDESHAGEYQPCVIFGVTSIPSRALHFSILCESGAQWSRIPIHMIRHEIPEGGAPNHSISDLQMWDCHGWDFSVNAYDYLAEMACEYRSRDGSSMIPASYIFTLDHTLNGYSQYPPEHKCYHILRLEDGSGQVAAMPNNRIIWHDDSFIRGTPASEMGYKVMSTTTYHAEVSRCNAQDSAFLTYES
jgi:hypothetical protein